jgi:hypothetical protein
MPRALRIVASKATFLGLIVILLVSRVALSQQDPMGPTRDKLHSISNCIGPDNLELRDLSRGLLEGWGRDKGGSQLPPSPFGGHWGAPVPPPPEYLESLDRDIEACRAASELKDEQQGKAILDAVRRDIAVKASDCKKFGASRLIPVLVTTLRGSSPENGWVVFYKWMCASGFATIELRMPELTSPAIKALAPGEYTIRAEKKVSDVETKKTDSATLTIGSEPEFHIQLPIQ